MKRLLSLAFALGLCASAAYAEKITLCNGVTTNIDADCTGGDNGGFTKVTAGKATISMAIFAVNATTGLVDESAVSTSEAVIKFRVCAGCPWQQFPKVGDLPITDINGNGRSFRLPPKVREVWWDIQTLGSGRVTAVVDIDD